MARTMLQLLNFDVLGLQEVSGEQRVDLEQDLIGYRSVGQGRDPGGRGEQCPVFFRHALQVEAEGMFWLSPTPLTPSVGWDAQLPRICTWTRFPGLTVFNAHLDHAGAQSRRESLHLIRRMARGSAVIMGDFNDSEGTPALHRWRIWSTLFEPFILASSPTRLGFAWPEDRIRSRISVA